MLQGQYLTSLQLSTTLVKCDIYYDLVTKISEDILNTGRNITGDWLYSATDIVEELYHKKQPMGVAAELIWGWYNKFADT